MRRFATSAVCSLLLIGLPAGSCRACTCFGLTTPDGPIFGANLDYFSPGDGHVFINQRGIIKEGFQPGSTGKNVKWISEYGSVTFNLAGRELAFGGMNEAGLVVGMLELAVSEYPEPDERPALTMGGWVQYVLDTCGSVEEAVRVVAKVRIEDHGPANHYLIMDAKGDGASMEWFDGRLECRTGGSLPVKAMSNMPYGRALAALERGGPRFWWSNPGQSAERFAGAHTRCADYNAERDSDAIQYSFDTLTHVAVPWTKWSIVYDIPKQQIWYRTVESPTIKHLSFDAFDFSCEGPLLMLDINASLEGDVRKFFIPYDHDTNVRVLHTLCTRRGNALPEETVEELVTHFDSFGCVHNGSHGEKSDRVRHGVSDRREHP